MTTDVVRQRVEDWANAVRKKDIDSVMSRYAPSIVSFDLEREYDDERGDIHYRYRGFKPPRRF